MSDIPDLRARLRMTRSGRRHRIGKAHIRSAMEAAATVTYQVGDSVVFIGVDDRGVELEIVVVPYRRQW